MQELEKILEEIEEIGNIQFQSYTKPLIAVEDVIKIIRKHINDGWIPVGERLPEDDRMVLVTCQTKKGIRSVNRAYYDGAFWHGSGSMSGVIAWRPLPEPCRLEQPETCKYTGGSCCWPIDQCKECPNYPERSEEE